MDLMDTKLRVCVLIDHRPNHPGEVGGLAGTWERVCEVAQDREDLDLTLFFLGDETGIKTVAPNVRWVMIRPVLGTERIGFLRTVPTHTDLAPIHPRLLGKLKGFRVIHTTDAFHAFAKTGLWASRIWKIPLVNSVQTDIIGWARIYTPRLLGGFLPLWATRWLLGALGYLERQERSMERRFRRYMKACRGVMISHKRDYDRINTLSPETPCFFLRRGIDLSLFHPERRDRAGLCSRYGIPQGHTIFLFVGRLDPVKGIMVAAQATRILLDRGYQVHLLAVGDGSQRQEVKGLLGNRVTLTGNLPHQELPAVYASSDLLLFPSEAEVWPNVVMEARCCGLAIAACKEGASHLMKGNGVDGLLLTGRDPEVWASQIETVLGQAHLLREMGHRARKDAEARYPSWSQVLEEDILPVWRWAAGDLPCSADLPSRIHTWNFPSDA